MIKLFNNRIFSFFLSILIFLLFVAVGLLAFYSTSASERLVSAEKNAQDLSSQLGGVSASQAQAENLLREKDEALKEAGNQINSQTVELESLRKQLDALKASGKVSVPPVPDGDKIAYLTFDDGPSKNTPAILSVLANYDAKATFFVINTKYNEYMTRIVGAGHTLAMHSYSHNYEEIYQSEENYFKDLDMIHTLIEELTGVDSRILRFPGGSSNRSSIEYCSGIMTRLTEKIPEMGYVYFDWNVDSADASASDVSPGKILDSIQKGIEGKDQVNILMHDTDAKTSTLQALPLVLDYLVAQGYEFRVLTPETPPVHHTVCN